MDIVSIINQISFADAGKSLLKKYQNKKKENLRWVIEKEMRQGDFSRVNEDDMIAIFYRLTREALEGTAICNLRLMARLICGLNEKGQLTANNFQKHAKILADLDENEIVLLATTIKYLEKNNDSFEIYDRALDNALIELFGEKQGKINILSYHSLLTGLQRTGLVVKNGMGSSKYKYGHEFSLTPKFKELVDLFPNWEDIATYSCVGNKER